MYGEFLGTSTGDPKEGTLDHLNLEKSMGFSYQTLLGELMFAYVTCCPDIAYALTTLSKFSFCPTKIHFGYLKGFLKYLCHTKHWGIHFCCSCLPSEFPNLPDRDFKSPPSPLPSTFPSFPTTDDSQLVCYANAAYANNPCKRRSTTGYAITLAGGAVVYKSKTQSCTALSSTKAEFYSVVSAAKAILYLRSVLCELHLEKKGPTTIFEDNEA